MKKNKGYYLDEETVRTLRHIFAARIDHSTKASQYMAWHSARDIVEYALAGNYECLKEYDYLLTKEDCGIEKSKKPLTND